MIHSTDSNQHSRRFFLMVCFVALSALQMVQAQPAKVFLQKAINAYGPWNGLQSFRYASSRTNNNPWQSYSFTEPKQANSTVDMYVDVAKGAFHNHIVFEYPGGYVFDLITMGKDSVRYVYDYNLARNGHALQKAGRPVYLANKNSILQTFPYFIVQQLAETTDSLNLDVAGENTIVHRYGKNGSHTAYHFTTGNGLLQKIEREANNKKLASVYAGYKTFKSWQIPGAISQLTDGETTGTETLTAFEPNAVLADSLFSVPSKYKVFERSAPKATGPITLAKDVYMLEGIAGDRNVVFVNMNDYIVVTEAPVSAEATKAVIAAIHEKIPGKPIRYVHLSHHHNDHIAGIGQMVMEGATILSTAELEKPVRAILNGAFGPVVNEKNETPAPKFELINGIKVLEDKDHRIELHEVKNSHAAGMTMFYLPNEKILYQSDLLTIPEDETITPAIAVTKELKNYMQQNRIIIRRMIGHHGHAFITPELFDAMLTAR